MKRPNSEIKQDFDILHSKALFRENTEKDLEHKINAFLCSTKSDIIAIKL